MDFGLSDEPGDDLGITEVEGLVMIRPMDESRRHEASFMEGFGVFEIWFHEGRFFWIFGLDAHGLDAHGLGTR